MRLWRARLAICAVGALTACQLVGGIDDRELGTCSRAQLRERPTAGDGPSVAPIVLATNIELSTKTAEDGRIAGFDLDGVCADGTSATDSCAPRASERVADDPDGRDNATLRLLERSQLQRLAGVSVAAASRFHLLVEISDYNGQPDDPDVTVAFYNSHGAEPADETRFATPAWNGADVWSTTKASYFDGVQPKRVIDHAYVSGGVVGGMIGGLLVEYGVPLGNDSRIEIELSDAVIALPLEREGDVYRVEGGIIQGRWSTRALLGSLAVLPDPAAEAGTPSAFFCGENPTYRNIRDVVCTSADIARLREGDRKGAPCDALSIVLEVSAKQARRGAGPPVDAKPLPSGCAAPAEDCAR